MCAHRVAADIGKMPFYQTRMQLALTANLTKLSKIRIRGKMKRKLNSTISLYCLGFESNVKRWHVSDKGYLLLEDFEDMTSCQLLWPCVFCHPS